MMEKRYLGDGVYVTVNRYQQIVLTAENGQQALNTIYLEPAVWKGLLGYARDIDWASAEHTAVVAELNTYRDAVDEMRAVCATYDCYADGPNLGGGLLAILSQLPKTR